MHRGTVWLAEDRLHVFPYDSRWAFGRRNPLPPRCGDVFRPRCGIFRSLMNSFANATRVRVRSDPLLKWVKTFVCAQDVSNMEKKQYTAASISFARPSRFWKPDRKSSERKRGSGSFSVSLLFNNYVFCHLFTHTASFDFVLGFKNGWIHKHAWRCV